MIVPDVNLLLYACDSASPLHARAAQWWQECLSGSEPVGLAPVVIFGFIRVGTNRKAFLKPMTCAEAAGQVRSWLNQPVAQVLVPGPQHFEQVISLLQSAGATGDLVTDAQIAALAMEHGAVVHTTDADFVRFSGLRWFNPISGLASGRLRRK
jgi:toxin-antitoxin system PIN domain toxin